MEYSLFNLHVKEGSSTSFSIASTLFLIGRAWVDPVYTWSGHLRKQLLNKKTYCSDNLQNVGFHWKFRWSVSGIFDIDL